MSRSRTLALDGALAAALAAVVLAGAAGGHSANDAYPTRWERDTKLEFQFDREFPEGAFRKRVVKAAKNWNAVHKGLRFKKQGGKTDAYPMHQCGADYQDNVITRRKLDGSTLGLTTWCTFSGTSEIFSFQIAFDRRKDWNKGKGKPKKGEYDLLSVAAHEFGHSAGRTGHFGERSPQCKKPSHTLCPVLFKGDSEPRTPAKHDKHTFKGAY